ncbi:PX and WD40 domain-containing protein [Cryptosporidium ubiquitum]|uniref:PX and WD40 domain-containing protein n=1 Tax=Cryptosporidium ubiquitum TaxID=857276 RepID=A0A1J4MKZ4_9CRYT|nr:PX and WD40 domain-containing protein [Cryptosporidium ubiquitum]OII74938.1 PX and WD40 domain-containing protein [Cryptosporidium ubiquitum]
MNEFGISTKIIGWKTVDGKVVYRISVCGQNSKYEIQKRFSEFVLLQSLLIERGLGLLPSLPPKTLFTKNQDMNFINGRMKGLQSYLSSLILRHDVLLSPLFMNFLELPTSESKPLFMKKLVNIQALADIASIRQSVSGVFISDSDLISAPLLFVSHQENSSLSRLGKVWSIIDSEETGFIFVWCLQPYSSKSISYPSISIDHDTITNAFHNLSNSETIDSSKFGCLVYSGFPHKCKNIVSITKKDTICIFSELGTIDVFEGVLSQLRSRIVSGNNSPLVLNECIKPTKIQLHGSPIAFVYSPFLIDNNIKHKYTLSVGIDNSIRLFCFEQMKIISGGNLNKRINGSRITSCYLENEFGKLGFFGSSSGQLLVLDMTSQPPYLITNINPQIDCKYPITSIIASKKLLIVAYTNVIKIFGMEVNPKHVACIISDNQPIRSIDTNFFSDMDIGTISSLYIYEDEYLFVGGTDVLSLFKLNINEKLTPPVLLFSYAVHAGKINYISIIPDDILKIGQFSNQNIKLLTASEDGRVIFWRICNLPENQTFYFKEDKEATSEQYFEEKKIESEKIHSLENLRSIELSDSSDDDLSSAFR